MFSQDTWSPTVTSGFLNLLEFQNGLRRLVDVYVYSHMFWKYIAYIYIYLYIHIHVWWYNPIRLHESGVCVQDIFVAGVTVKAWSRWNLSLRLRIHRICLLHWFPEHWYLPLRTVVLFTDDTLTLFHVSSSTRTKHAAMDTLYYGRILQGPPNPIWIITQQRIDGFLFPKTFGSIFGSDSLFVNIPSGFNQHDLFAIKRHLWPLK